MKVRCKYGKYTIEEDAESITDDNGVYEELSKHAVSFVELTENQQDVLSIQDIKVITVCNDEDPDKGVEDMIKDGYFVEMANNLATELFADL